MGASAYGAVLLFALALAVAAAETKRPEEPKPAAAGGDAGVVVAAGRHNVTIFAPRNEAMERDLEPRNLKSVQTLLLFHVLPARHPAGSWPAASHPPSPAPLSPAGGKEGHGGALCARWRGKGRRRVRKRRIERCVGGGLGQTRPDTRDTNARPLCVRSDPNLTQI